MAEGSNDVPREKPPHEIQVFMEQLSNEMASEYTRIRSNAVRDPGTAGDEGEENWKTLLESWLPPTLPIVTKGQIIGIDGALSPQVDLLVLSPSYPKKMLNKKKYLAGGVLAAFECKLTLKKAHIVKAAETCRRLQEMAEAVYRPQTARSELMSPIAFGVLAHSHNWADETAVSNIDEALMVELYKDELPRRSMDLLCVSNLACWQSFRLIRPPIHLINPELRELVAQSQPSDGAVSVQYNRWMPWEGNETPPNPLYVLINSLLRRLAWEVREARGLAAYWNVAGVPGGGSAGAIAARQWPLSALADDVRRQVQGGRITSGIPWDDWMMAYY